MKLDEVKKELNKIIKMFQKNIEEDEKAKMPSSNYDIYKEQLEKALELKEEINGWKDMPDNLVESYAIDVENLDIRIL